MGSEMCIRDSGQRADQLHHADKLLDAPAHREALVRGVRGVEDHEHCLRTQPGPRPEGQRWWRSPTTTTIDDDGGSACTLTPARRCRGPRGRSPLAVYADAARPWRSPRRKGGASRDCARVQPAARGDAARVQLARFEPKHDEGGDACEGGSQPSQVGVVVVTHRAVYMRTHSRCRRRRRRHRMQCFTCTRTARSTHSSPWRAPSPLRCNLRRLAERRSTHRASTTYRTPVC